MLVPAPAVVPTVVSLVVPAPAAELPTLPVVRGLPTSLGEAAASQGDAWRSELPTYEVQQTVANVYYRQNLQIMTSVNKYGQIRSQSKQLRLG